MDDTRFRFGHGRRSLAAVALPIAAALVCMAAPSARADGVLTPFSTAPGPQAPAPWRFSTLPNKAPTKFEITQLDGQKVLKVDADKSYGNLVHPTRIQLDDEATLSWRWKVEEFVEGADLRTKGGDDGAAKVCVFFDFPADRLSVGERAKLALAKSSTGEAVPTQTLCYVWDVKESKGSEFDNAFTKRIRMDVLESGATDKSGGWLTERRKLVTDYKRAFGAEAGDTLPDVVGVAIQADADNTKAHGISYFSDIDLRGATAAAPSAAAKPAQ
ncbi:DUF3047 domain-containing protein [Variovorax sp. GT1P44]|uniref:DUF3047 domain-containing protein n=1 Tax=Variovorax sp. GT1P44 TaxID=3443742 RepID=UPI003F47D89A